MTDKYDEIRENVSALLAKAGVTYSAEFVPQSKSRNATEKEPSIDEPHCLDMIRGLVERCLSRGISSHSSTPVSGRRSVYARCVMVMS